MVRVRCGPMVKPATLHEQDMTTIIITMIIQAGWGPSEGDSRSRMIRIEQDIFTKNDGYAAANRARLSKLGILALDLVSSPGAGKMILLTATVTRTGELMPMVVIEGDQEIANDAERIRHRRERQLPRSTPGGRLPPGRPYCRPCTGPNWIYQPTVSSSLRMWVTWSAQPPSTWVSTTRSPSFQVPEHIRITVERHRKPEPKVSRIFKRR